MLGMLPQQYNDYKLKCFGPTAAWTRRIALWPVRSTHSGQRIWLTTYMAGYLTYRASSGDADVKFKTNPLVLTEHELTMLTLTNFRTRASEEPEESNQGKTNV